MNKLVFQVLDSRVPPGHARRNEVGEMLLSGKIKVFCCPVPVVGGIGAKKVSKKLVFACSPVS